MLQFAIPHPPKSNLPGIATLYTSLYPPGCAGCSNKICDCVWGVLDDGRELLSRDFYIKYPQLIQI
jgi:hypothetical protein